MNKIGYLTIGLVCLVVLSGAMVFLPNSLMQAVRRRRVMRLFGKTNGLQISEYRQLHQAFRQTDALYGDLRRRMSRTICIDDSVQGSPLEMFQQVWHRSYTVADFQRFQTVCKDRMQLLNQLSEKWTQLVDALAAVQIYDAERLTGDDQLQVLKDMGIEPVHPDQHRPAAAECSLRKPDGTSVYVNLNLGLLAEVLSGGKDD